MQATRGASLSPSDDTPTHDRRASRAFAVRRTRCLLLFGGVALGGYLADLVTKLLVVSYLTPGEPVRVVDDLLRFNLARNPGAAFSTGTSYTLVISLVAIAAAIVVLWVARRLGSAGWAVGLGFLLAGVLGNLTDRIFREPGVLHGHVVDFLQLPHFPVFNLADVCINIAAVFVIVQAVRGIGVDGRRHEHNRETSAR